MKKSKSISFKFQGSLSPRQRHSDNTPFRPLQLERSQSTSGTFNIRNHQNNSSFSIAVKAANSAQPYEYDTNITQITGIFVILVAFFIFIFQIYALIISKLLMPYTGNPILDWIKDDHYYCALLPALVPVSIAFAYLSWVSMKFLKHS